ncbi:MAG: pilus assembly protein TadG-related protein [Longimicrobiaceae bacterium]
MKRLLSPVRNERGATFVFFVAMIIPLLSLAALAADVGVMHTARSEAQRAAEAAALAGAGLYMNVGAGGEVPDSATVVAKAREYALTLNGVGKGLADSARVQVFQGEQRVRVTVYGKASLLFARIFGRDVQVVDAVAAARVMGAQGTDCVKPFAIPDLWEEKTGGDKNGDKVYDQGENWTYEAGEDHYKRYSVPPASDATGYGSALRDGKGKPSYVGDQGRRMTIKQGHPKGQETNFESPEVLQPGIFLPLVIPDPAGGGDWCPAVTGGGGDEGASQYKRNIACCNPRMINVNDTLSLKTGRMVGPTQQGMGIRIPNGENTTFDEALAGKQTPRVIKLVLYDPGELMKGGKQTVVINNIALMYVESVNGDDITGRFLKYAEGVGQGTGSLIKTLQLVE